LKLQGCKPLIFLTSLFSPPKKDIFYLSRFKKYLQAPKGDIQIFLFGMSYNFLVYFICVFDGMYFRLYVLEKKPFHIPLKQKTGCTIFWTACFCLFLKYFILISYLKRPFRFA